MVLKFWGERDPSWRGRARDFWRELRTPAGLASPVFRSSGAWVSACLRAWAWAPSLACSAEPGVRALQRFISSPPPRSRHYCRHLTLMLGAASWERSNVVLRDCAAVPPTAQDQACRWSRAQAKPSKGRRGETRRREESEFPSSCLETGGQMWSELRWTD